MKWCKRLCLHLPYLKMVRKSDELLKTLALTAVVFGSCFLPFFFCLATCAVPTLCAGWRSLTAPGRCADPDAVESCSTRCLMLRWDLRFEIFVAKLISHSGALSAFYFFLNHLLQKVVYSLARHWWLSSKMLPGFDKACVLRHTGEHNAEPPSLWWSHV